MNKIFKSKKDVFNFILGLILLALFGYIIFKIGVLFVSAIIKLFDNYSTIAVALITGFLAFITVPVGKFLENRYSIKNKIREERQEVYIDFLNWLIRNVLNNEITNNKNVIKELKENQNKMVIYASDNVLKAWADFRNSVLNSEKNKDGMNSEEATRFYLINEAPKIENLIMAIRKELGYKNKNIKQYDILKLYINDINKYL